MNFRMAFAGGAVACALAFAAFPVAAAPQYVGLQYDEIVRMVMPQDTPPPPGSFADAYRQILADAPATSDQTPAPKRHGLAGLIGNITNAEQQMSQAANQMQSFVKDGHLTRQAFYNGWVRTDDVVAKTAVIEKCKQHEVIDLDLAHKTYKIVDTSVDPHAACPTPDMPGPSGRPQVVNEAPGTATLKITAKETALGPMTVQNVPTSGYTNTVQMAMTNATGSCKNGSFGVEQTRYVSRLAVPRRYCPLPKTRAVPTTPVDVVVRGGCKPTMTANAPHMYWDADSGKLEMYSRMAMLSGDAGSNGRFTTVTQRGNVNWLTKAQADALFSVPAGFTKQ